MILLYLTAVNLAAFVAMGWDKRLAAAGGRRISEATLLRLAALGGVLGAIAGQQAFRHKTRKEPFRTRLWLVLTGQAVLVAAWMRLVD